MLNKTTISKRKEHTTNVEFQKIFGSIPLYNNGSRKRWIKCVFYERKIKSEDKLQNYLIFNTNKTN